MFRNPDDKLLSLKREFFAHPNLETSAQILTQLFRIRCLDSVVEMQVTLGGGGLREIEITEGIEYITTLTSSPYPKNYYSIKYLLQGILIQKPHLLATLLQGVAKGLRQFILTSGFLEAQIVGDDTYAAEGYVHQSDYSQVQIGLDILNELQSYELAPSLTTATTHLNRIDQHKENLNSIMYENYTCNFEYGGAIGKNATSCNLLLIIKKLLETIKYNLLLLNPSLIPEGDRPYRKPHDLIYGISSVLAEHILAMEPLMAKTSSMLTLGSSIYYDLNEQILSTAPEEKQLIFASGINFRIEVWFNFITLLLDDCIPSDYASNPQDNYCPNCDCWNCRT